MPVDEESLNAVIRRLHRAEGQIRGVTAMLESGRDCGEVLGQIAAVSHALNGAGFMIIVNELRGVTPGSTGDGQKLTLAQLEELFLSLA